MRRIGGCFCERGMSPALIVWGALADCLLREHRRNAALQAFGKQAAIDHILPIFNLENFLNFEVCHCSATLSKLKSVDLDNFVKLKKLCKWVLPRIYYSWCCVANKAIHKGRTCGVDAGIPHKTICQGTKTIERMKHDLCFRFDFFFFFQVQFNFSSLWRRQSLYKLNWGMASVFFLLQSIKTTEDTLAK